MPVFTPPPSGGRTFGPSSRSGVVFVTPPGGGSSSRKKKGGRSFGGFLGNLLGDVKGAALGIPVGLVQVGKAAGLDVADIVAHPTEPHFEHLGKIGRQVGRSYAETYGPLFRGDVDEFLAGLYEHPVGPVLDVATVATGGAGAVAKGGQLAAKAGVVSRGGRLANLARAESLELRSPRAIQTGEGPTLRGRPLSRNPAIRGRQKLVHRGLTKLPAGTPVVGEHARFARELERAPRRDALRLQHRMDRYARAVDRLNPEEQAALALIGRGVHPADYLALLEKEGAKASASMKKVLTNPKVRELVEQPTPKLRAVHREAVKLADEMADVKIERGLLTPEAAAERPGLHRRILEEEGIEPRELPLEPFYTPDVPAAVEISDVRTARGGVGVPRKPGSTKRNEGVLFRTGQLALTPDVLGPEFLRTVRYGLYDDLHGALVDSGVEIPKGQPLPKGYEFVRRSARERIHAIERTSGERESALAELIPDPDELERSELSRGFGTTDPAEAAETAAGNRLIVPTATLKRVGGEFTRQSAVTRAFLTKPTQVWRAIVLGYRPGFLVNNVVGNHLLFALRNAGPAGMRAYLNAVRTSKGPAAVEKLLRDPETRNVITPEFIAEHFPEHMETFGSTQAVRLAGRNIKSPTVRRGARAAAGGIVPATQALAEGTLRRAAIEAALRRSPELRAVARELSEQTPKLEELATIALERNPGLQRRISQEVMDTLGDYTSLSPFERNVIRSAIPFYAWYRAIGTITLRLAADRPATANLLRILGEIGQEAGLEATFGQDFPSYLEGAIPLGPAEGGTAPIFTTQGVNPFATVAQMVDTAGAIVGAGSKTPGETLASDLNPFLLAGAEQLIGRRAFNPNVPVQRSVGGLVGGIVRNVGEQLPPTRVVRAGPTRLYPARSRLSEALAASGAPIKRVSLAEARRRAEREKRGSR